MFKNRHSNIKDTIYDKGSEERTHVEKRWVRSVWKTSTKLSNLSPENNYEIFFNTFKRFVSLQIFPDFLLTPRPHILPF